jgi:cell division protein FtsB
MRIKRSVKRFFMGSIVPAIAIAVTAYFGYYTLEGPRGLTTLTSTNAQLAVENGKLADLQNTNGRMKHRIDLLAFGHADPDLVTEIARSQMLASSPGEVAIPRDR